MSRDQVFATPQAMVVDFAFNEAVADVFPDMIRRSVPGYESIMALLGVLGRRYIQPDSYVYDLGCSLGAATLALALHNVAEGVRYVGVDSSEAMVSRCGRILERHLPRHAVEVVCADIGAVVYRPASLMVLNFTLQFIALEEREGLLRRLYDALLPGGVLVLSEKLHFEDLGEQVCLDELYMEFKRANGYSELEISQKRAALEGVLVTDSRETHVARLKAVGFGQVLVWFQGLRFVSFLAVK